MAGEWPSVEIGSVAEIYDGPHATPPTVEDGPIFLGIDALDDGRLNLDGARHVSEEVFRDWTRRVVPTAGDLVFSYETRIGQAALIPPGLRCCLGRRLALVRPKSEALNSRYLLYYYLSPGFQDHLRAHTKPGSTVDRIHLNDFPRFPIAMPSRRYQDEIADLLGSLDDKIELNRRMTETLEAVARALFKSWFVDFDPVHAKAEGRPIGLPDEITALFPNKFDAEGLPAGWRVASLRDLATLNPESWTKATIPEKIEYVDLANTKWGRIEAIQTFPNSRAPSRAQRVLRPGDTIVGIVRPGNGSFAYIQTDGLTGSTGFAVLRPISPNRSSLVYLAATARENIEALAFLADGAAYPAVSPADVIDTRLILPKADIIDAFDAVTSPLLLAIHGRLEQSRTLANLRDTLLPKLISGELRIADAEAKVSAA